MATWQNYLQGLAAARETGVIDADDTSTDANAPDLDDLADASADRTDSAGDGPDVEPVYEPPRPVINDQTEPARIAPNPARPLTGVAPSSAVAISVTLNASESVQFVPASGGRARRTLIVNTDAAETVHVSPDRRDDTTGHAIPAGRSFETSTQTPVYVYNPAATAVTVTAWAETYPMP